MRAQFVVLTSPVAGKEVEFNQWYDEVHLVEVTQVPGVVAAVRAPALAVPGKQTAHGYLAVYDIENDDPASVVAEIFRRWETGEMRGTDAMGTFDATLFGPFGPVVEAAR